MVIKKLVNIVCHYSSIYGGNFIPSILYFANENSFKYKIMFTFPVQAKGRSWANYIEKFGYKVEYIDFSNKSFKKQIKSINKNNNVNVMYTHFLSGLRVKHLYMFSKRVKLLIHVHSDFTCGIKRSFVSRLKAFIEHKILRKDAQYIFVSDAERKKYSNKKYIYLPNALCLERIPCPKLNYDKFCKDHNILKTFTLFLTFGWSPFVKGIDLTVKSFLRCANENDRLIVVHGKDDGYKKCIDFLCDKIGNVDFLKDKRIIFIKPEEDIFALYRLCDVFISSSRSEGFSYSILEALYFNLKVLSSDIPGVQWSKKYKNVSFFNINNNPELDNLIKDNSGHKKDDKVNSELLNDYDIKKWSAILSEQFENID